MKKRGIALSLLIIGILTASFICAQDTPGAPDLTPLNITAPNISGIGGATNAALEKDIVIPENLQIVARILFGIEDSVKFDVLIVLICVWIAIIILIQKILQFMPFFDGWKSWIGSLIVVCLMSITGSFAIIVNFWFSFANIFGILEKWSVLKVVVVVLFILMIAMGLSILLEYFRKKTGVEVAENQGMRAGFGARMVSMMGDMFSGRRT